ncbi:MAG: MarR family winged helix-turn-helix transcriptional regulator [Clostridia bacterium]
MMLKYLNFNAKLRKIYKEFCAPVCKKYAINQTGYDILLFLGVDPAHNTARDIQETCMVKSSLLSVTIEKLIRAGYLKRENDRKDRRVQRLIPTKCAEALIADGFAVQRRFEAAIFQEMTEDDLALFESLLNKLLAAADKLEEEGEKERGIR